MRFEPGAAVRVRMAKWPSTPHGTFTGAYLGADEHGDWIGARAGTPCQRSGSSYAATSDWVTLLPQSGDWRAGFYDPALPTHTYVDITTDLVWGDHEVDAIDLDLDVVRLDDGSVHVEDEDEFEQHRVELGYPDGVVAQAQAVFRCIEADLRASVPPFDGSHEPWLARLRERVPT